MLRTDTFLLVIDVQQKLMPVIHEHEDVARNVERLVRGAHVLEIPALLTEQYVKGLGPTIDGVRLAFEETGGYRPIEKMTFSGHASTELQAELRNLKRKHALVAGVETHVCVWQTVRDLLGAGFGVTIAADAVSSRSPRNRDIALRRMESEGAKLGSTEMALFELTGVSGTDEFRAISRLIK